jgi:hypothetical protein
MVVRSDMGVVEGCEMDTAAALLTPDIPHVRVIAGVHFGGNVVVDLAADITDGLATFGTEDCERVLSQVVHLDHHQLNRGAD